MDEAGGRFGAVQSLRNHWAERRIGALGFYWFLTFEESPELHALVRECQRRISFPYYDPTPFGGLHVTLGKVAESDRLPRPRVDVLARAALEAVRDIPPFSMKIERLSGTRGAIGFDIQPQAALSSLRASLCDLTSSVVGRAVDTDIAEFDPHITIAYANTEIPAGDAVRAVARTNSFLRQIEVPVESVAIVHLRREEREYAWEAAARIPLGR